jgi:hypothetical protein
MTDPVAPIEGVRVAPAARVPRPARRRPPREDDFGAEPRRRRAPAEPLESQDDETSHVDVTA